jgi:hypothetical protein
MNPDSSCLMPLRFDNDSQSSAALSSCALKALEYCLGGQENWNVLRSPIDHPCSEGAIDDAEYRSGRRPCVDCEGFEQIDQIIDDFVLVLDSDAMERVGSIREF